MIEQIVEWQARPLDAIYPIVYLDCIVLKIRQDKRVINKSIFLALGINTEGHKDEEYIPQGNVGRCLALGKSSAFLFQAQAQNSG